MHEMTGCFHLEAGLFEQSITQRLNTRLEIGRLHGLVQLACVIRVNVYSLP